MLQNTRKTRVLLVNLWLSVCKSKLIHFLHFITIVKNYNKKIDYAYKWIIIDNLYKWVIYK